MKHYQNLAFDAANEFCKCKEGEDCYASPFMHGFEAGFKKARELAADKFKNGVSPNSRMIHKELLNLGE